MNTTPSPAPQAQAQDVVLSPWKPMSSAPVGDKTARIDIWSGSVWRRYTDCFWGQSQMPGRPEAWHFLEYDPGNGMVARLVPDPAHWMAAPPEPQKTGSRGWQA